MPSDSERQLPEILDLCHLTHLSALLDVNDNWAQALSLGEQQRIAFARILLQRPDFIFLDEATASLDEEMEEALYQLIRSRLGNATIISAGRRRTLLARHESKLRLTGGGKWLESSEVKEPMESVG